MDLTHGTDPSDLGALTRRLELDSLRLLSIVAREGSYARAARVEPLTASAISKRIAELERAMGYLLLERSAAGVRPTLAGELVLNHWNELAASLGALLSVSQSVSNPDKVKMSVVADPDSARFLVFDCLAHLEALEDDASIAVTRAASGWLPVEFEKLAAHTAIWSLAPPSQEQGRPAGDLLFQRFAGARCFRFNAEVCVAVVRNDHPLASLGLLSGMDLEDYELACGAGVLEHVRARMSVAGGAGTSPGQPRVRVTRPSWSHQVAATLEYLENVPSGVVALLPTSVRYVMHRYPGLRCLTLTDDHGCSEFAAALRDDAWLDERVRRIERLTGCQLVPVSHEAADSGWADLDAASTGAASTAVRARNEVMPSLPLRAVAGGCNGLTAS